MKKHKVLPLRGLNITAKPFNKRAIAWSCDAELAMAADDSIHVFLPEFPYLNPSLDDEDKLEPNGTQANGTNGNGHITGLPTPSGSKNFAEDGGAADTWVPPAPPPETFDPRQQFFEGSRHFPVSHPNLKPELNEHLWNVAGKEMPFVEPCGGEETDYNAHPGAGTGVICSAGSTINHVVAIEWSPSGVGRNLRPVLAVLTACGTLAIYGEGGPAFGTVSRSLRIGHKGRAARDLGSWIVLWAVGEAFVIPGQEDSGWGERIKAFSWCQEVGPGRALLAYMNDQNEIVIVGVGTEFKLNNIGVEEATWNVMEACRFEVSGAHLPVDLCDPDFVPSGSCVSLKWSPWLKTDKSWTCLLSYMDRNYVGFRKITLRANEWEPTEKPTLTYDDRDWDGRCIHLGPDAFLEFENWIWEENSIDKICRGIIATPLVAEKFAVNLSARREVEEQHSSEQCNNTFPTHVGDRSVTNPIMGLIIHPITRDKIYHPPAVPFYTAVRLSATATNAGWFESNAKDRTSEPQWAVEIHRAISVETPLEIADRETGHDDDSDEESLEEEDAQDEQFEEADSVDENEDEDDIGVMTGPDVHPHRIRIWGLATSPGGGSTVVLTSTQLTQKPERGGWQSVKSRMMFDFKKQTAKPEVAEHHDHDPDETAFAVPVGTLTAEGRLWEWMYGGGPGVPGISITEDDLIPEEDADVQASRQRVKALFAPSVEVQKCSICDDGTTKFIRGPVDSVCVNGHRMATCGASGLAIQEPGISRACGVCGSRCLKVDQLVKVLPPGQEEVLRSEVSDDFCTKCGGKYLD